MPKKRSGSHIYFAAYRNNVTTRHCKIQQTEITSFRPPAKSSMATCSRFDMLGNKYPQNDVVPICCKIPEARSDVFPVHWIFQHAVGTSFRSTRKIRGTSNPFGALPNSTQASGAQNRIHPEWIQTQIAAREGREALDCGGLTPLFLSPDAARSARQPVSAQWRAFLMLATSSGMPASTASKAKAGSSPRTPKAGATLHEPLQRLNRQMPAEVSHRREKGGKPGRKSCQPNARSFGSSALVHFSLFFP